MKECVKQDNQYGIIPGMNDNCDFTYEKLMDAKKEIMETKFNHKAAIEGCKERNEFLSKATTSQIDDYLTAIAIYNGWQIRPVVFQ